MNAALIALGANLGKPVEAFSQALIRLSDEGLIPVIVSGVWQSPAWPAGSSAPDYRNAVVKVSTSHAPESILNILLGIEAEFGRERTVRNAPRTLDLDLITYGQQLIHSPNLSVPHPRLQDRAFVLLPLSQVMPTFQHPLTGQSIDDMLGRLKSNDVLEMHHLGQMLALPHDSH